MDVAARLKWTNISSLTLGNLERLVRNLDVLPPSWNTYLHFLNFTTKDNTFVMRNLCTHWPLKYYTEGKFSLFNAMTSSIICLRQASVSGSSRFCGSSKHRLARADSVAQASIVWLRHLLWLRNETEPDNAMRIVQGISHDYRISLPKTVILSMWL